MANLVPQMTANDAPSPYVAAASSEYYSTYLAYKAFDHSVSNSTKYRYYRLYISAVISGNYCSIYEIEM